jgi:hypothetical protein
MSNYRRDASTERDRAISALQALDAGVGREEWVHYSIAAKASGVPYDDWLAWCQTGSNYSGETDCRSVWRGITEKGGAGPGKLFALAKEAGWQPPRDEHTWSAPRAPRNSRTATSTRSGRANTGGEPSESVSRRDETPEQAREALKAMALKRDLIWKASSSANPLHPYLVRKNISEVGLRQIPAESVAKLLGYTPKTKEQPLVGECLIVPLRDVQGNLISIELIDQEGRKAALYRLPRKGTFWLPDPTELDSNVFCIGVSEGVATSVSIASAAGHPVVSAGAWGNIEAVAKALVDAYPRAEIVIYPDRGAKQEKDARAIATAVLGRSIPMPSKLPEGYDYNDMAEDEGLDAVRAWVLPKLAAPGYRVTFHRAVAEGKIDIDEILPGLPRGTIGMIVGQGAIGKTMLSIEIAAGLALGRDLTYSENWVPNFLCPAKNIPRKVALILGEDNAAQIHNRLVDMAATFQLSQRDLDLLAVNLELLTLDGFDLRVISMGDGKKPEDGPLLPIVTRMGRWAEALFIDPLIRLHDSDENDNTAAAALMLAISQVAKEGDCAVVLLHHVPKAKEQGKGDWRVSRGAAALSTSARWQVFIRPAETPTGDPDPRFVHLALVKHNYCAPWPRFGLERKDGGVLIYTPTAQPDDAKRVVQQSSSQSASSFGTPETRPSREALKLGGRSTSYRTDGVSGDFGDYSND